MKVLLIHLLCLGVTMVTAQDVCKERPIQLSELSLRSPLCKAKTGVELVTDRWRPTYWYSVSEPWGATYRMLDNSSIPSILGCGTMYPIYLRDRHPTLEEGEQVEAVACFVGMDNNCADTLKVKVRRCYQMYQYELIPAESNSAYCFELEDAVYEDGVDVCPLTTTTPVSTTTTPTITTTMWSFETTTPGPGHDPRNDGRRDPCHEGSSHVALIVLLSLESLVLVGIVIYVATTKRRRNKCEAYLADQKATPRHFVISALPPISTVPGKTRLY